MRSIVIIPIYKAIPSDSERKAIINNTAKLSAHDIAFVAPNTINTDEYLSLYPSASVVRVSDKWLGSLNGIAGYNTMMLSADFYKLFTAYDYLLVCHTDAWIFSDKLNYWTSKGYDCVAAPWVKRKIYNRPIIKHYMALRQLFKQRSGELCRADLYGKIGNGGLSLRYIDSFIRECENNSKRIAEYLHGKGHFFNEDVFWAIEPQSFKYPSENEALSFAFDTNPAYCFQLTNRELPMGCHSWSKPKMWRFWKNIIH